MPPPAKKAASQRLQWRFEIGKSFLQEMTTITEQNMKVMGNDVRQVQEQTFVFRWTPLRHHPDGSWTFRQKIEKVKLNIDIGGNRITFDSTEPAGAGPLADFFRTLVGLEYQIRIGPDLKIRETRGRAESLAKVLKSHAPMKAVGEQILYNAAADAVVEALFLGTPSPALRPGDSWEQTGKLDLGPVGTLVTQYRFTHEGLEGFRDKVKIGGKVTVDPPSKAAAAKVPFRVRQGELTTKEAAGTLLFDRQRGRLDRLELRLAFEGRFTMDIGGQETMVDVAQTQRTTIAVTDPPGPGK
jgi:hypothetical protein